MKKEEIYKRENFNWSFKKYLLHDALILSTGLKIFPLFIFCIWEYKEYLKILKLKIFIDIDYFLFFHISTSQNKNYDILLF